MSGNQHGARLLAQFGCALLVVAALLGFSPAAHAADVGSVTIVKSLGEGDTARGPLAGIRFQLNRVEDIPVVPTPDLGAIAQTDAALMRDGSGHQLGPAVVVESDEQGRATAQNLPDGVYLVRELPSRVGDVAYSVIAPFLVALPTGQGDANQRSVEVRAKNLPLTVTLEAAPETVAPGGPIQLDARGSVPAPDRNGQLHRYALALRVDRRVKNPRVSAVTIENAGGTITLQEGRDYTVRYDEASGTFLTELTPNGLALLAAARANNPDTTVHVRIDGVAADDLTTGDRLDFAVGLFTDGWPVPADLSTAELRAAAADEKTIQVLVDPAPAAPSSSPVIPGPPTAVSPSLPALPSAQTPRPGLPWSGGADGPVAPATLLPLALFGLVVALRRNPRRTEAATPVSRAGRTSADAREDLS